LQVISHQLQEHVEVVAIKLLRYPCWQKVESELQGQHGLLCSSTTVSNGSDLEKLQVTSCKLQDELQVISLQLQEHVEVVAFKLIKISLLAES
jgi:hypothetical protein